MRLPTPASPVSAAGAEDLCSLTPHPHAMRKFTCRGSSPGDQMGCYPIQSYPQLLSQCHARSSGQPLDAALQWACTSAVLLLIAQAPDKDILLRWKHAQRYARELCSLRSRHSPTPFFFCRFQWKKPIWQNGYYHFSTEVTPLSHYDSVELRFTMLCPSRMKWAVFDFDSWNASALRSKDPLTSVAHFSGADEVLSLRKIKMALRSCFARTIENQDLN